MLQNKAAFLTKPSDLIFDLTNHRPSDLVGYWFHSLEKEHENLVRKSVGSGLKIVHAPKMINV